MDKLRTYFLMPFAWMLCLLATACSDDDEGYTVEETRISKTEMAFTKSGGTETLSVLSAVTPEVASNQDWCTVTYVSVTQRGTYTYNVEVEANTETDTRTATILVEAGSFSASVQVTQLNADYLVAGDHELTVNGNGDTISLVMQTSGDYEISYDAGWIHRNDDTDSRTVYELTEVFIIDPNVSGESRTDTISFTLADLTETITITQGIADVTTDADNTGMELDATELLRNVYIGWNLGNSMEVPDGETAWGNPATTEAMIDAIYELGFNAVRIPCAWDSYIVDGSDNVIDASWLARVKEVVDYCVDNDMYTILNIHWDGGWLEESFDSGYSDEINAKQEKLWTQIATFFRDYDGHLLFAGCNEPGVDNASEMATLLAYEQTFVDAVRATGGRNYYRNLIVQGPSTDIDNTYSLMNNLPSDLVADRMIVEVHYYSPSQFCILEEDASWGNMLYFWGDDNSGYATGDYEGRWSSSWNESYLKGQFDKMQEKFVARGIPVIIGEFGVYKRTLSDATAQEGHDKSRADFDRCVVGSAKERGITPFYWDAGDGIFNRNTLKVSDEGEYDALMEGAQTSYPD